MRVEVTQQLDIKMSSGQRRQRQYRMRGSNNPFQPALDDRLYPFGRDVPRQPHLSDLVKLTGLFGQATHHLDHKKGVALALLLLDELNQLRRSTGRTKHWSAQGRNSLAVEAGQGQALHKWQHGRQVGPFIIPVADQYQQRTLIEILAQMGEQAYAFISGPLHILQDNDQRLVGSLKQVHQYIEQPLIGCFGSQGWGIGHFFSS